MPAAAATTIAAAIMMSGVIVVLETKDGPGVTLPGPSGGGTVREIGEAQLGQQLRARRCIRSAFTGRERDDAVAAMRAMVMLLTRVRGTKGAGCRTGARRGRAESVELP
jgi:hypothetical protein